MTVINGHTLSSAELSVLDAVQDYMRKYGGDRFASPNTSPAGDGRWVQVLEIFPRYPDGGSKGGSRSNAHRQTVRRLHVLGVLKACEIAYYGDCVKLAPIERIDTVTAEASGGTNHGRVRR